VTLARYDLRLRSLDRAPGEPINLCSRCESQAYWSVWLHTPEWGPNGGVTYVLCTVHALAALVEEVERAEGRTPSPDAAIGPSATGANPLFTSPETGNSDPNSSRFAGSDSCLLSEPHEYHLWGGVVGRSCPGVAAPARNDR
jgi:hypothetical protein